MKKQLFFHIRFQMTFCLLIAVVLLLPQSGFAASTGQTALFRQFGSGYAIGGGDYISSSGGRNTYYRYFIEVPAGLASLQVDLFDGDVGASSGGNPQRNDWQNPVTANWNTSCNYILFQPNGTQFGITLTLSGNNASRPYNNAWVNIYTVANPAAGHWELRVDTSSSVTTGDDNNGYGIRAHDGTPGAGGTELPIYAYPYAPVGMIGTTAITTTLYPYATAGCEVDLNDFDGDNGTNICRIFYASRNSGVSATYNGSGSEVWLNTPITNFETNYLAVESGLWTVTTTYTDTGAAANFGVFYVGNYLAGNPPPTAAQEPNMFRMYLPADNGSIPAKPAMGQKISYVSGPNPATVGGTTRVRVEIVVFNPTAQSITFSASNLVRAYVPGSGVVYAGKPEVSQGTIISQPAIGGSGAITWNPGIVAGNDTFATLYYEVNVTPTTPGQVLPVTGTPASNGTTFRYVDQTGNTTQTLATYTYGPLCRLAVTEGGSNTVPTWAVISKFKATLPNGQPAVEWHTASEHGTIGFYLWRKGAGAEDYQLVNPNFLPSLPNAVRGGVYQLADPYARYGETAVYYLVELEAGGRKRTYGPYEVTFDAVAPNLQETDKFYNKHRSEIATAVHGFKRSAFTSSDYEKTRYPMQRNALQTRSLSSVSKSSSAGRLKISVQSQGLYYIDADRIATGLGLSVQQVTKLITSQKLDLSNRGESVAWRANANHNGIYFYGENLQNAFNDRNIYWLEQGKGLALKSVKGGTAVPADPNQTFLESRHYEENYYEAPSLFTKSDDDIWFWDFIIAGDDSKVFSIQAPGRAASGTATLTVHLNGATDITADLDHHVTVFLNGTPIGESQWDGMTAYACQFSFDQSLLNDGENLVAVSGVLDGGVSYSIFWVESFDLSYQRHYRAENNSLLCRGDNNQTISVTGFIDSPVMIWDVSKPKQPKLVSGVAVDPEGCITFKPAGPKTNYLVIGLSAVLQPLSLEAASSVNLKKSNYSAEYLVIAPEEFVSEARPLADYRQSQGLRTMVVSLEDIYDSFNWGLASPLAIKDFLGYAYSKWKGKRLSYAVLIGKGTYDYKNYLGYGDNLVPAILAYSPEGLFAGDNLYGDVKGNDGIPEIAIGRLPVLSVEELRIVIEKIKVQGNSPNALTGKTLMIADNPDEGGDFLSGNNYLIGQIDGGDIERIDLFNPFSVEQTRQKIIDGFNGGAAWINYVGHAGLDQLAEENILHVSDLPFLQNGDHLPMMVLLTCVVGRFEIPGSVTLSEALLLKEHGGIVAALAPSGGSYSSAANHLGGEFYKAVFSGKNRDWGTAWLYATKQYIRQGGQPYLLNIYNLLGDPAMRFQ